MQIYSQKNATSPLFTKINAIPQICTSGGDVYYASRNLLIHLFFLNQGQRTMKIAMASQWHYNIPQTLSNQLIEFVSCLRTSKIIVVLGNIVIHS